MRREPYQLHDLGDAGAALLFRSDTVDGERQSDDLPQRLARVQRGIGVLEDRLDTRGDFRAADSLHRPAGEAYGSGGGRQKSEKHARERRLAASRFADDREHFALPYREGHVVHRAQRSDGLEQAPPDPEEARDAVAFEDRRLPGGGSGQAAHDGTAAPRSRSAEWMHR